MQKHYPHVIASETVSEEDETFQTLKTRQGLFEELDRQGLISLEPDDWLGKSKTEGLRNRLAKFGSAQALEGIDNLINPELLRETKIPTANGCFTGELPNRSQKAETILFDTLWQLHRTHSEYASRINRITHGQQSEVQRSREDMARLSSEDFAKLKTEMSKHPQLDYIQCAMEQSWSDTRTVSNLKKMLNGVAEVTVIAFRPKDLTRSEPELADKWSKAMENWRARQASGTQSQVSQNSVEA